MREGDAKRTGKPDPVAEIAEAAAAAIVIDTAAPGR